MTAPDASVFVAGLLAAAAGAAMWRGRRAGPFRAARLALQPVVAALLYALLFPPAVPLRDDTLTVFTEGAQPSPWAGLLWPQPQVALPEAAGLPAPIERVPDLATALRRHPAATRLQIEGEGLTLRDQDALTRLSRADRPAPAVHFDPAPARGLLALQAPAAVALGTQSRVQGRVAVATGAAAAGEAAAVARVELRDPSGGLADAVVPKEGRFALSAPARAAGPVRFEVRLLDAKQRVLESAGVPLAVHGGQPMTVIVRAGAPDAELKYWRRWAQDAGLDVRVSAGLSEGIALRAGDASLTPAALAAADLLIADERAWAAFTPAEVGAIDAAVRDGLGLLLRATGVPEPSVAADWARLGWTVQADDAPHAVGLDRHTGLRPGAEERVEFTVAPVRAVPSDAADAQGMPDAPDAEPLLRADDGEVLAARRDRRQGPNTGRVALWRLLDSYRLTLAGEPARYASLWAQTLAQLARPRELASGPTLPVPPGDHWQDERMLLCGLGQAASIVAPDGSAAALPVDATTCAAWWPAQAGWHRLQSAARSATFYVRAPDDAAGLRRARDREATLRLARAAPAADAPHTALTALPRWPFFLLWLVAMAVLMGLERRARSAQVV